MPSRRVAILAFIALVTLPPLSVAAAANSAKPADDPVAQIAA